MIRAIKAAIDAIGLRKLVIFAVEAAAQDALLGNGQIDPGRVFVITQEARPATDAESRVRLELSLK